MLGRLAPLAWILLLMILQKPYGPLSALLVKRAQPLTKLPRLSWFERRTIGAIATRSDDLIEYEIFCRALQLKRSAMLRGMTAEERFRNLGKKSKPTKRTTYGKTTIRSKEKGNDGYAA